MAYVQLHNRLRARQTMSTRRETDETNVGFLAHVEKVETRVDNIERDLGVLSKRFDAGMKSVSDKLDALVRTVAGQPRYAVSEVLDVIVKSAMLIGACASAIIWISTAISAGPVAEIRADLRNERERVIRLERLIERLAEVKVAEIRK